MALRVPRGRLLVKVDQEKSQPEVSVGKVVDVGPNPTGVLGEEMAIHAKKGDEVFFHLYNADETIQLDDVPHAVIDHFQVKLLRD